MFNKKKEIGTEPVTSLIHYKRLIIQLDFNNTSQNGSDVKPIKWGGVQEQR